MGANQHVGSETGLLVRLVLGEGFKVSARGEYLYGLPRSRSGHVLRLQQLRCQGAGWDANGNGLGTCQQGKQIGPCLAQPGSTFQQQGRAATRQMLGHPAGELRLFLASIRSLHLSDATSSSNHTNTWWLAGRSCRAAAPRTSSNHTNKWWLDPRRCRWWFRPSSSNHTNKWWLDPNELKPKIAILPVTTQTNGG